MKKIIYVSLHAPIGNFSGISTLTNGFFNGTMNNSFDYYIVYPTYSDINLDLITEYKGVKQIPFLLDGLSSNEFSLSLKFIKLFKKKFNLYFSDYKDCIFIFNDLFLTPLIGSVKKENKIVYLFSALWSLRLKKVSTFFNYFIHPNYFSINYLFIKYYNLFLKLIRICSSFFLFKKFMTFYFIYYEKKAIYNSDLLVFPSYDMLEYVKNSFHIKNNLLLSDWPFELDIDTKTITKDYMESIAIKYNFNNGLQNLLFIGRKDYQKGVDILLIALKKITIKCNFIFVGLNYSKEQLKLLDSLPNLNIIHIPYIYGLDKYVLYSLADIFIVSSIHEPFGYVYLEGDLFSKNMVCFNSEGIKQLNLKDKSNIVHLNSNLINNLSNRINWLLNNPNYSLNHQIDISKYINSNILIEIIKFFKIDD